MKNNRIWNFISNNDHYYFENNNHNLIEKTKELQLKDFSIYHIEELTFEDKAPRKEAFENVLSALRIPGVSFLYLILGDDQGVHFYFGIVKDLNGEEKSLLDIHDIGKYILKPSMTGNFRGSEVKSVKALDKQKIKDTIDHMKYYGFIQGIPGINEDSDDFQGVDRLIDVMLGDEFGLAIISKPLSATEITEIEKNLYKVYSSIYKFVKTSRQEGESTSKNTGKTKTTSLSETEGNSLTETETSGKSKSEGATTGKNKSTTEQTSTTKSNNSESKGNSHSGTEGSSDGTSSSKQTSNSASKAVGKSQSKTKSESDASSESKTQSKNETTTTEVINKEAQDWINYLDEVLFPRLDYGKSKGMFVFSTFVFSNNKANLLKLGHTVESLYSAKSGNKLPLNLELIENNEKGYLEYFKKFQIPQIKLKELDKYEYYGRLAISQYMTGGLNDTSLYMGNWVSTNELSLIAGLPQKEIVGLSLKEEVEFGLNINKNRLGKSEGVEEKEIVLGNLIQSGRELEKIKVSIHRENLDKHVFITGVTGSGKTTTCQKILIESQLPFLVIEPAKTEYRILTEKYDDLLIFTLGKDTVAPFRLNPFEFFEHESITSRVDMIKASLEASFDMEAAIPQILETAIYQCYEDYGWNIATNKNERYTNPFADGVYAFPTLENLINKIEVVVKQQGFDERLKNDYIGSIKARLQGLIVGSKGLMLNTKRSIDFMTLVEQKVVLELEEIRSGREKSLIMGFVLTNLIEAMKAKYLEKKGDFKHITLVEEAHRLLSKYMPGDNMNKKQGVEVFSDMLAEVRKYGESLVIVDQIPNKLTPEVLKNTNTKIVHKIFAKDDKEAIGNTMALSDEQKDFLSNLDVGRAIVFTQGWHKAMQVKVIETTNTTSKNVVLDRELRKNILRFYSNTYKKGVLIGLDQLEVKPSKAFVDEYMIFIQNNTLGCNFEKFIKTGRTNFCFKEEIEDLFKIYDIELLTHYLTQKFYIEEECCSLEERKGYIKDFIHDILDEKIKKKLNSNYDDLLKIGRV